MSKVNKTEFVRKLAKKTGMNPSECSKFVSSFTSLVMDLVEDGNSVQLKGFGTFKSVHFNGRKGRNPNTGEKVYIQERNYPVFRSGSSFRHQVRKAD